MQDLKTHITSYAIECGFDLVRITGADEFAQDREAALSRIKAGQMDGLPWFTESRVRRGSDPQELLPGARSIICLGLSYLSHDGKENPGPGKGKVARYARVKDYHRTMKRRMKSFVRGLEKSLGTPVAARWYVDDGPMLDRAAAARSGLGWFGKSTNILTPSHGSWVLLGQILYRRLPHRRHNRPLRRGQRPLHLLPDHREPGCDSLGDEAADRRLGLWMRHLPGRVPGQPQVGPASSAHPHGRSCGPIGRA